MYHEINILFEQSANYGDCPYTNITIIICNLLNFDFLIINRRIFLFKL